MNVLLFLLIATFWGGSFIAIKDIVDSVPPVMAAAGRVGVALALLAIILPLTKRSLKLPLPNARKAWLTGIFMIGIPFSFLFWGEKQISPGLAGILNGTVPLWTFFLSLFFLRNHEPLSVSKVVGLVFGITGLLIIFYPKIALQGSRQETLGALSVCAMALSYGIGTILARLNSISPLKVDMRSALFHQLISGFLFLLVVSFIFEDWSGWYLHFTQPRVILAELYLGGISTALAFIFFYHLLEQWGVVRTSAVTYIVPMMGLVFDFLFNGRLPTFYEFCGALTIFAGVLLIQLSNFRKNRAK